jgi:hypothetical protein
MRWSGHATRVREERNAYSTLVGKHKGTRSFLKHVKDNNIKMQLKVRFIRLRAYICRDSSKNINKTRGFINFGF